MNSRSLYRYLLRLHPACFRKQYEDQMLWIFDESVQNRGVLPLLLDATVSLVRQWLLRSAYWRRAPLGNAETLHRRAWRLNLAWLVGTVVVYMVCPLKSHTNPIFIAAFITMFISYSRGKYGRFQDIGDALFTSLDFSKPARDQYRFQLEAKRDGLRDWRSRTSMKSFGYGRGGYVLLLEVFAGLALWVQPYFRHDVVVDPVRLWEFVAGLGILIASWVALGRINDRAAEAYQQEIDAMDATTPTSIPLR